MIEITVLSTQILKETQNAWSMREIKQMKIYHGKSNPKKLNG